jgi:hypothetical protein
VELFVGKAFAEQCGIPVPELQVLAQGVSDGHGGKQLVVIGY